MVCHNRAVDIHVYFGGRLAHPSHAEEALAAILAFCREREWPAQEWSMHVSGVAMVTAAQMYRDSTRPVEPWTAVPGGFRPNVNRNHPRINETNYGIEVTLPNGACMPILFTSEGYLAEYFEYQPAHWMASQLAATTTGCHDEACELLGLLKTYFVPDLTIEISPSRD